MADLTNIWKMVADECMTLLWIVLELSFSLIRNHRAVPLLYAMGR